MEDKDPARKGDATMPHPRISSDEIERRGRELYERVIRDKVETEENIGKVVCMDIETGDYELDDRLGLEASERLLAKHPGAAIWSERIGYDAVVSLGGGLTRTTRK
jgi:hypothetical protein